MEVLRTLDAAGVAAEALAAAVLQATCIFFCLLSIDFPNRKAGWRSIIYWMSWSLRKEPGVLDLFFNTRYLLESVKISCLHWPEFEISSATSISISSVVFLFWPRIVWWFKWKKMCNYNAIKGSYCYWVVVLWSGGIDGRHQKTNHCCWRCWLWRGQDGSLFWLVTKKERIEKEDQKRNCTKKAMESVQI